MGWMFPWDHEMLHIFIWLDPSARDIAIMGSFEDDPSVDSYGMVIECKYLRWETDSDWVEDPVMGMP